MEIEHLSVAVVFVIHAAQAGVGVQHGLFGLDPVILHQLSGDADPAALMECADLHLGVGQDLLRAGLDLAGLDVQLVLENVGSAEGADAGQIGRASCRERVSLCV